MSKRDWRLYLEDIIESVELIKNYTQNMEFTGFQEDRKTIDAVVRNFEIIGEASKFIPQKIKQKHSDIDWQGILGLRNRIAHEYFDVSPQIIWQIATDELLTLKNQLKKI